MGIRLGQARRRDSVLRERKGLLRVGDKALGGRTLLPQLQHLEGIGQLLGAPDHGLELGLALRLLCDPSGPLFGPGCALGLMRRASSRSRSFSARISPNPAMLCS